MRSGRVTALLALLVGLVAAPHPAAAAPAGPTGVVAYLHTAQGIVPLNLRTRTLGKTIALPQHGFQLVVSADGRTGWVRLNLGGTPADEVRRVDLVTRVVGPGIPVGQPDVGTQPWLALSPDGSTLYAGGTGELVVPIKTATSRVGTAFPVHVDDQGTPQDFGITPDGRTAVVPMGCDQGYVAVLDLPTRTIRYTVGMPDGRPAERPADFGYSCPEEVTVAPDGRTAYLGDVNTGAGMSPLDLRTQKLRPPVRQGGFMDAFDMVVTPDSGKVYVSGDFVADGRTDRILADFPLPGATGYEVQPSGRALLVPAAGGGVRDLYTGSNTLGPAYATGVQVDAVTFAPGQAPTARFQAATGGRTVRLDGRASVGTTSPIVSYHWQFGDGTDRTCACPQPSHTYARSGRFTVRLTVTDGSGTSTEQLYSNRQVLRNGLPRATTTRTVTVP